MLTKDSLGLRLRSSGPAKSRPLLARLLGPVPGLGCLPMARSYPSLANRTPPAKLGVQCRQRHVMVVMIRGSCLFRVADGGGPGYLKHSLSCSNYGNDAVPGSQRALGDNGSFMQSQGATLPIRNILFQNWVFLSKDNRDSLCSDMLKRSKCRTQVLGTNAPLSIGYERFDCKTSLRSFSYRCTSTLQPHI